MTAIKPMTGEQLDELMTVAVNMQRDSEANQDRPSALFAYAVQVAVMELRNIRDDAAALAAENADMKKYICDECYVENIRTGATSCAGHGMPKTPGTDAYLAEVRAQGVEMFAKEMHAEISEADAIAFAAQLRQGGTA
ncbi:TPA: hypothetical protein HIQ17_002847 [Escherichia coli]|uniref:hypothetical protein n=1 Tax=Escherichia coli TaxID=562 RepID=UPI000F5F3034|nr:hypothetical protein [Escherichia coli]MCG9396544.1 hypothetical protein [Escherichia coli]RRB96062.1 hypothetical protein EIA20_01860 [Escherichia coli]HAH9343275.1 hypothetical protein [Escherichia coli]HBB0332027.1 hypothetical protein [Escherichia coli]